MPPETIQVNFGRPFALFPLSGTMLMPHGVLPLQIFEPRYKQMVVDALDDTKQFAMATFHGDQWEHEYHGRPAIRPVVCLGHIVQHMRMEDGTYRLWLQGLCRARIVEELPPDDELLYRRAVLRPIEVDDPDELSLASFRRRIVEAIETDRLGDLRGAKGMLEHLKNDEIPTSALVEVLGFQFLSDQEVRYRLLATDDAGERAALVSEQLMDLQDLLRRAQPQRSMNEPKGCHWN